MSTKPPPLNRDYDRDPYTEAVKRRRFINHGSTLRARNSAFGFRASGFTGLGLRVSRFDGHEQKDVLTRLPTRFRV